MGESRYVGVTLLLPLAQNEHFGIPGYFLRRLPRYMRILQSFQHLITTTVPLPCLFLVAYDLHLNFHSQEHFFFSSKSAAKICLVLAWDYIFIASLLQMLQFTGVYFAHLFLLVYYFKKRFLFLRLKLAVFSRRLLLVGKVWGITNELTALFTSFLALNEQISFPNGVTYYACLTALECQLFLMMGHTGTPLAMRIVATAFFTLVLTIVLTIFICFSNFHSDAKGLLKSLHFCQSHVPLKVGQKLLLEEREYVFAFDRISMNMAGIFTLTRGAFIRAILSFIFNFMLLLSLTEN